MSVEQRYVRSRDPQTNNTSTMGPFAANVAKRIAETQRRLGRKAQVVKAK